MFKLNPITNTDSYKLGHMRMYPEGTTKVYSNFTPRSENHLQIPQKYKDGKIVWFGIQATLMELHELWNEEFFKKPWAEVKDNFVRRIAPFVGDMGFNVDNIEKLHTLGYLPIQVKSLPEGAKVPIGVPVFTIINTNPDFYWLTNYLETCLSNESWLMTTSATIAHGYNRILNDWADKTGGNKDFTNWQAHDFSMRGMEGSMAAAKSGAGHLLSSMGTDSLVSLDFIDYYYSGRETFLGGSVPASEHSVMTFNGIAGEKETIRRLIEDLYPVGIVSVVADSFDFWKAITEYAFELKDVILNRQPDSLGMAKVVFRPDSGDPVKIITGLKYFEVTQGKSAIEVANAIYYEDNNLYEYEAYKDTDGKYYTFDYIAPDEYNFFELTDEKEVPEYIAKGAVECLWDIFGGTTNNKLYRTLNQRVGLIYGDSITPERANTILQRLADKGFASDNIVFGVGSYTYQYNTRDTLGFAVKATWGTRVIDDEEVEIEIFKDPKTDSGLKKSAKGLLRVEYENGKYVLYDQQTKEQEEQGELKTIYMNGMFMVKTTFAQIRERLQK